MRRYSCAADAVGEAWRACGVATSKLLGEVLADFLQLFSRRCPLVVIGALSLLLKQDTKKK